jgi:hypothetical protein
VAYNEFDSTVHQRMWNLRFPECRTCPKKGIFLTRDLRQEDLCVDPLCYRRLDHRERNDRVAEQLNVRAAVRRELEKVLARDDLEESHLQILVFTLLELMGSLADEWRNERALSTHANRSSPEETWNHLSSLTADDLITAAIEFCVMYLAAGAGHALRVPDNMARDLAASFSLSYPVIESIIDYGESSSDDALVEVAAADVT